MRSSTWQSRIYAFMTVFIWSTVYIPTRQLYHSYTPTQIGLLRYIAASVLLLIVAVIRRDRVPAMRDWPLFLAGGISGFSLYIVLFNTAANMLASGVCSFVVTTSAIFTVVFAAILFHEQLRAGEIASLIIQLAGVGVLTLSGGMTLNVGVVLMLIAAISLGTYNLIQRRLVKRGYSAIQITTWCIVFGTAILVLVTFRSMRTMPLPGAIDLGSILYLGVVASAAAYYLWARAMSLARTAGSVTNHMFLVPFLTSIIGWMAFHEQLGPRVYIGGGLLTIGFLTYIYCGRTVKSAA